MAKKDIRRKDDYPEYILNGVQSFRWVKPSVSSDLVNFDQTDVTCSVVACRRGNCSSFYCSQDGCPPTTQAFYALTESGDVYVTTPNGVIFYLPSGSNKDMKVVYPTNHTVSVTPIDTNSTNITLTATGKFTVKFDINHLSDPESADVVTPELPRVYPWRPGSDRCTSSVVAFGEKSGTVSSFIIGDPSGKDPGVRPKCYAGNHHGSKLTFPYSNGYYCVQTDHNRCVVFYRGEEIYNGEYSGYGISAPFAYGLTVCLSTIGCNPRINNSDIKWSYSLLPKWLKTDDDHFIITTQFDIFVNAHEPELRDEKGKIKTSNVLIRKEDKDGKFTGYDLWTGYFAIDPTDEDAQYWETLETKHRVDYSPKRKYKGLKDFLKRRDEQYEPGPGVFKCNEKERRFDIYKIDKDSSTGLGEYVGYIVAYVEKEHIIDEGRLAEVRAKITELNDWIRGTDKALKEFKEELARLQEEDPDSPKVTSLETTIASTQEELKEARKKRSELEDEEMEILGPDDQEDCVTGEFHGAIRLTDTALQNEVNDHQHKYRVWWLPSKEEVWCGTYADERVGVPAYDCNYSVVFRSDENLSYTHRVSDGSEFVPSSPPRNYYWYVGNGVSEGDPDSNFRMSRWREELCVSCSIDENNRPLDNEVGASTPCPCQEDIITGYTSDEACLFTNHETQNAAVCGKCNYPIDFSDRVATGFGKVEEPCWSHSVGCPPEPGETDENGNMKTVYKLAHYCRGEVGRVDLENLGGRINSIFYEDGTESDWAYINKGETACRTKKDYTVVGEIKGPEELPGIYNYDKKKKKASYQRVDVLGANAVILRAPSSKCKPVEVDGKTVCEGDIIDTSITTFPRGEDWLVRRTITSKKTKKVKCFNIDVIDPISGFDAGSPLDGHGFNESDTSAESDDAGAYPCLAGKTWDITGVSCKKKDENNVEQTVSCDFTIPKDSRGNGRGNFIQVEVTAVEKTFKKETITDTDVYTESNGSTLYTWSLNEVDSTDEGIRYTRHGRTYCYADPFWGECDTTTYFVDNRYERGSSYGQLAEQIRGNNVSYRYKGQEGFNTAWSAYNENDNTPEVAFVTFTQEVVDELHDLADQQIKDDSEAFFSTSIYNTNMIWYRDIVVKADNDPDIQWTCRHFTHCFTPALDDIQGTEGMHRIEWGFEGLRFAASGSYWPYGSCVTDLYDRFPRKNFNWTGIDRSLIETTLTVSHCDAHWLKQEPIVVYEPEKLTGIEKCRYSIDNQAPKGVRRNEMVWKSGDVVVSDEDQLSWSKGRKEYADPSTDVGHVIGETHYVYRDTKKLTDNNVEHIVNFDLTFKDATDYHFSYVTGKENHSHAVLHVNEELVLTGNFEVEVKAFADNASPPASSKKSDFREVRYKFMRFYPAYLTRPDYYFKMNDAETEVTARYGEDTESFMERLREWSLKPEPTYKGGDNTTEKLPSASPKATCSKTVYTLKYAYQDGFYDFQNVSLDPFFTEYEPRKGFAYNRSDYKASKEWRFIGYEHSGNANEDANVNGDTLWYAKWQLISDENIIVKVPFPKPQGRCYNYTVRHLSKFRSPSQGVWYCTGPAGSEADALDNYLGSEIEIIDDGDTTKNEDEQNPPAPSDDDAGDENDDDDASDQEDDELKLDHETTTSYDEFSGIKWVQCVNSWGDPDGPAIRAGSMVGDIYYCQTEEKADDDGETLGEHKVFEDFKEGSDQYWYWNGFQWVDGNNYFSSLGTEKVIFYKNEGKLLEGVGDSEKDLTGTTALSDKCYNAKAIFIGRADTLKACGNVLAVNLGRGLERHAAIFYKAKPIWDRPANSHFDSTNDRRLHYFVDGSGKKMEELMVCVCNAFTLLTYSIADNKQVFRLWANAAENESGYSAVFDYDDVPDISRWQERGCDSNNSFHRDENGNLVYPDYMVLHSRSGKKLYLFYKNQLIKTYQEGEWYKAPLAMTVNMPGTRGPSIALIQTGAHGDEACCDEIEAALPAGFVAQGTALGVATESCAAFDIWLDGSLYKKFSSGRILGAGLATAVFGDKSIAWHRQANGDKGLAYDIVQLTGLGKTFIVPHHLGIVQVSTHGAAGYTSSNNPQATKVLLIPDTPGLPGVLGDASPDKPANISMNCIRSGWSFYAAEFNGEDKVPVKGYNIWDVTMSELQEMWFKTTTYTNRCGCRGVSYVIYDPSATFFPVGVKEPYNCISHSGNSSGPEAAFTWGAKYFLRPEGYQASRPVLPDGQPDDQSEETPRQTIIAEKLWTMFGYKDKKVSEVYLLGSAGAHVLDRTDPDAMPDGYDFTYEYNNKTRYCKYYEDRNGEYSFPYFQYTVYPSTMFWPNDRRNTVLWGVSTIFGGEEAGLGNWEALVTGDHRTAGNFCEATIPKSKGYTAHICGEPHCYLTPEYDARLSDRTTIHDISVTYYLVVLRGNKWHIVDQFTDLPATGDVPGNRPTAPVMKYINGELVFIAPETHGGPLVPPTDPGCDDYKGVDCVSNDFVTYETDEPEIDDTQISYSLYDKHDHRFFNCKSQYCYDTEMFYSNTHDVAYAFHGSTPSVREHDLDTADGVRYGLAVIYLAGSADAYLQSAGAVLMGPTDDGLNIMKVYKSAMCHGMGETGLACTSGHSIVYDDTIYKWHKETGTSASNVGTEPAFDDRDRYVFWQMTGNSGIVLRIKDGKLKITDETVPSPCLDTKGKYKCGKYLVVVNTTKTEDAHFEYDSNGHQIRITTTTYTYDYSLYYNGYELASAEGLNDDASIPKFLACCSDNSDYAIVVDDKSYYFYYQDTLLGTMPIRENWAWRLSCCGKAALFTQSAYDENNKQTEVKQLLLIEGKVVAPFTSQQTSQDGANSDLASSFSSARWKTIDLEKNEPLYSLSCCGVDYYLLQRGEYVRKHEPTVTRVDTDGVLGGQHPIYTHESIIDMDPEKTYGILEDGTKVYLEEVETVTYTDTFYTEVKTGEDSYDLVIDHQDRYTIEYPLLWATCQEDKLYDLDMSPLTMDEYKKRCGEEAMENAVFTEDGTIASVRFYHDINYSVKETGSNIEDTHEVKEETIRYIPWKTKKEMAYREAFVYYKTSLISTDPRVKEITCFRYENEGTYTVPDYHAIGAYSIFYDDPFNDCYERSEFQRSRKDFDGSWTHTFNTYTELPAVQNIIGVAKVHKGRNAGERILVNTTPPSMELEYLDEHNEIKTRTTAPSCDCVVPPDDAPIDSSKYSAEKYFCIGKGRMTAVYPNVCMLVWHKARCMTRLAQGEGRDIHKNDTPYIPFWDGTGWDGEHTQHIYKGVNGDKTIVDYRNNVIYINDLNAAGRWDRVSGDDPVDEWDINWPYTTECAGFGGFWVSAPDYHPEKTPSEPHDPDGRLIVSGNNTLFVFDKKFGMLAYDILTGKRVRFS